MSSHASLDRESFQSFLANAFAVQNSGLNRQLLSALIEVQHFITEDEFTFDRALDLIADRALKVCNASGIAIALLEANQLVYRAGSGIAATDVGRHVPAVLSGCTPGKAGVEILRVENAQADSRIEAEICRQFGATSLLILPIYHAQAVAGVLQVHFIEAHRFLDEEVRTYRLMAGLVEEAMSRNVQRSAKESAKEPLILVPAITQNRSQEQVSSLKDDSCVPVEVTRGRPSGEHVTTASTIFESTITESSIFDKWASMAMQWKAYWPPMGKLWQIGSAVAAVMSFAMAILLVHGHHPVPTITGPALSAPSDTAGPIPQKPLSPTSPIDKSQRATDGLKDKIAPSPAFRRVRIGPDEVDYIAEDVTVRKFTSIPAGRQTRTKLKEVNIGQDVTVRYFARPSTLSRTVPAPLPTQTSERPSPASQ
jgi:hypothetical protein